MTTTTIPVLADTASHLVALTERWPALATASVNVGTWGGEIMLLRYWWDKAGPTHEEHRLLVREVIAALAGEVDWHRTQGADGTVRFRCHLNGESPKHPPVRLVLVCAPQRNGGAS